MRSVIGVPLLSFINTDKAIAHIKSIFYSKLLVLNNSEYLLDNVINFKHYDFQLWGLMSIIFV